QTIAPVRPAAAAAPASEPEAADDSAEIIKRLTALKGIGQKTAEAAVAAFGPGVLDVVRKDPERVRKELGARRAQPLIDAVADGNAPTKSKATTKRARARKSAAKK